MSECHGASAAGQLTLAPSALSFALVGSPNSGKSTLFNALTGLRTKTGNYPGVTVARYQGTFDVEGTPAALEDLPGVYSLDPISPDEQVVSDLLVRRHDADFHPDGLIVTADATNLRRSLNLVAQALNLDLPTILVLTFGDELVARGGAVDVPALERALGVPVATVTAGDRVALARLRAQLARPDAWSRPAVLPPTEPGAVERFTASVLDRASYRVPERHQASARIDAVVLHPVWGTLLFLAVMFAFFQTLFTLAAPLQDAVGEFFAWLGELAGEHLPGLLGRFVNEALIGGMGSVLTFVPQIALLFLLIALLEGSGYMARAAFLMDRVMGRFGLEGRAFVALLSSLACAIPGIMATRSLPSARDRLATMMAAPLMTCSARLPVYTILIALLVPETTVGPFGLQGVVMFALYLGGAVAAMCTAALWGRIAGRTHRALPFYMEIPPYRWPRVRTVAMSVYDACRAFVRKITSIILVTTVALWVLLNITVPGTPALPEGTEPAIVQQHTLEHSFAATAGKAVEPVFEPLGFDWRINIAIAASLSAREVFVSTLGQIAAASDPDDPTQALASMTHTDGPLEGQPLFTPATLASMLVFFMFALQCFSTMAVMRRESGGWRWPALAWMYMFALAWGLGALTHAVVGALM